MSWWNKNKWKVIALLLIVVVLAAAFWYGGGAPGMQGWQVTNDAPAPAVDTASQNTPDGQTAQDNQSTEDAASKLGQDQAPDQPDEPSPADVGAPAEAGPPVGDDTPLETVPAAEGDSPDEGIESRPGGLDGGMSASEKIAAAAELGGSDPDVPPGDKDYSEAQALLKAEHPATVQVVLKQTRLHQYFPQSYTAQQMEEVIVSLLETWSVQHK